LEFALVGRYLPAPFTPFLPSLSDQRGRPRSKQNRILPSRLRRGRRRGWRRVMADGKRTILPDLRVLMKLACGVFCDLDLDVVVERVVAAARHVSSAGRAPLGVLDRSRRELERFLTAGADPGTRRRIYAARWGRRVAELIANPVPVRVGGIGRAPRFVRIPGRHSATDDLRGRPGNGRWGAARGLHLTEKACGEESIECDDEAVRLLAGFAGVLIDHARACTGLRSCHYRVAADHGWA